MTMDVTIHPEGACHGCHRLADGRRPRHPLADAAGPARCAAGDRRRGAGAGDDRRLGRAPAGARGRRRAVGGRRAVPGAGRTAAAVDPRGGPALDGDRVQPRPAAWTSASTLPTSASAAPSRWSRRTPAGSTRASRSSRARSSRASTAWSSRSGAYFGVDVDGVVARLVDEQLEDGGWNCEVENGSVRVIVPHDHPRPGGAARA